MRSNSKFASAGAMVADRGDLERLLRLASALQVSVRQGVPKRAVGKKTPRLEAVGRTKLPRA